MFRFHREQRRSLREQFSRRSRVSCSIDPILLLQSSVEPMASPSRQTTWQTLKEFGTPTHRDA
jgi:hypothetical protein